MTTPRVIALLGTPIQNETGAAGEEIRPGHLVKGVSTILKHASSKGAAARTYALERDELGKGIDNTYGGTTGSAGSAWYAIGDTVKVGSFAPGMRVNAWVASGVTVVEDDFLESAGDGTLQKYTNGVIVGRAMEAVTATALSHISVEIY
jgi:hypothetical protein